MLRLLLFVIVVISCGCANTTAIKENVLIPHEGTETTLITEREFYDRVTQSATLIHEGFRAILNATEQYTIENSDNLPSGNIDTVKALLLDGGYIKEWPVAPAFAYTSPVITVFEEFRYYEKYADMDGNGAKDSAISIQNLKVEVCQDFARRFASPGFGDTIYDFEAEGKRYPGDTVGRHIKVFAVVWPMSRITDSCDILWVVQYAGFPEQ